MADQAVISGGTLLSSAIVGRYAGAEQLGLYALGTSLLLFLVMAQQSFVAGSYLIFGSRVERGEPERLYAGSMLVQLGAAVVAACAVVAAAAAIAAWRGAALAPVLWVLCAAAGPILLRDYARQVAFARFDHGAALRTDGTVTGLQVLGLLFLVRSGRLTAATAFAVAGGACATAGAVWLAAELRRVVIRAEAVRAEAARSATFGRWSFAANATSMLSLQLYPWLLTHFHGAAATAALAAAQTVVYLANPILQAIRNVLAPTASRALARGGRTELQRVVRRTTLALSGTMAVLCLTTSVLAGPLVALVYGPGYAQSAALVPVLAANVLANAIAIGWAYGIWALERPDVNFRIDVVTLTITTTLGAWLARASGPLGAAVGLATGTALAAAIRFIVFRRLLRGSGSAGPRGVG